MTWRYPMQYGGILIKYKRFQAGRSATGNQRINFLGGTQFVHFIAYTTAASSVRGSLRNHRETGRYSGKRRVCVYGGVWGETGSSNDSEPGGDMYTRTRASGTVHGCDEEDIQ